MLWFLSTILADDEGYGTTDLSASGVVYSQAIAVGIVSWSISFKVKFDSIAIFSAGRI